MPIDYTKLRKKLTPESEIDGDPGIRLKVGTVSAIDSSTGLVTLNLNGASVPGVASLSGAMFDVGSVVQVLSYRGSLLILGASNAASAQPVEASGSTTNGTTTSTSYVNSLTTTGVHGVVFIAPPSGKALLLGRSVAGNSNAGSYAQMDFEVRTGSTIGSGTIVRSSNNNTAAVHQSAIANAQGTLHINSLLRNFITPGVVYNACLTFAASGSTASFNRRQIAVYPQ